MRGRLPTSTRLLTVCPPPTVGGRMWAAKQVEEQPERHEGMEEEERRRHSRQRLVYPRISVKEQMTAPIHMTASARLFGSKKLLELLELLLLLLLDL